jgi:membrane protein
MNLDARSWYQTIKAAVSGWIEDEAPSKGAAIAYYAMFSMAPLLFIMITVAGLFFGPDAVRGAVFAQIADLMGENGAEAVQEMLAHVSQPETGVWATVVGAVVLVFGATTVFGQLQAALDAIWEVPDAAKAEKQNAVWTFIKGRLLSFGLVLSLAFLIVVSLLFSTAMATLGKWWGPAFGAWDTLAQVFTLAVSFAMLTVAFAAIFKIMPRADIEWRDVWVGAAVTSLLFAVGKFLIGLYLGKSDVGSSFGAFGSIIIVMVWMYYSAQIFLLGAEFTWVYAHASGSRKEGAAEAPEGAQSAPAADSLAPLGLAPQQEVAVFPVVRLSPHDLPSPEPLYEPPPRGNALVRFLHRKYVFGAALAAGFVGGAVLRRVIR